MKTYSTRKNQRPAPVKKPDNTISQFMDKRKESRTGKNLQKIMDNEASRSSGMQLKKIIDNSVIVQKKPNRTGLPDNLKSGIEKMSGYSMDNVKVHYNSSKPAQLNAHAYTRGTDIHVSSGQERHLPHEAWHVVQQMEGRVKPTSKVSGVSVNDNTGLEKEADVMGSKAKMA